MAGMGMVETWRVTWGSVKGWLFLFVGGGGGSWMAGF